MDNKYLKIVMGLFLSITLVVNPFLAQPGYAVVAVVAGDECVGGSDWYKKKMAEWIQKVIDDHPKWCQKEVTGCEADWDPTKPKCDPPIKKKLTFKMKVKPKTVGTKACAQWYQYLLKCRGFKIPKLPGLPGCILIEIPEPDDSFPCGCNVHNPDGSCPYYPGDDSTKKISGPSFVDDTTDITGSCCAACEDLAEAEVTFEEVDSSVSSASILPSSDSDCGVNTETSCEAPFGYSLDGTCPEGETVTATFSFEIEYQCCCCLPSPTPYPSPTDPN